MKNQKINDLIKIAILCYILFLIFRLFGLIKYDWLYATLPITAPLVIFILYIAFLLVASKIYAYKRNRNHKRYLSITKEYFVCHSCARPLKTEVRLPLDSVVFCESCKSNKVKN